MNKSSQFVVFGLLLGLSISLLIVSCALYDGWWPLTILLAYALLPVPMVLSFGVTEDYASASESSKAFFHFGQCMMGFVGSCMIGLPLVLKHNTDMELTQFIMFCGSNLVALIAVIWIWLKQYAEDDDGF